MDDIQKMVVVEGIYLDEEVEVAGSIVTFHHFGYLLQLLHHLGKVFGVLQVKANIGTCLLANLIGIDNEFRTFDYSGT